MFISLKYVSSMGPILKIHHPFKDVALIKIYRPTILNDYTISFLVMIDSRVLAFKLYQNGEWNEVNKDGVSRDLVKFIREQIEALYRS